MLEALLQFVLKWMPKPIQNLFYKYENIWRYCYYGAWTTVISYLSKLLGAACFGLAGHSMQEDLPNMLNTVISWIIAASFAYVVNKKYVFMSKTNTKKELLFEIGSFFGARFVSLLLDVALMWLTTVKFAWNYALMAFLVQFIILAMNYVFSKLVVFRSGAKQGTKQED